MVHGAIISECYIYKPHNMKKFLLLAAAFALLCLNTKAEAPQGNNTPKAVDLGLSVRWASFNLGATAPEQYGDYYAWGETSTKKNYDWSTYKWGNGSKNKLTKYNQRDKKTVLEPEDDVVHVKFGGLWRMPTDEELEELRDKCTWTATTQKGVSGYKVTGPNGNSIFLPAAGYKSGAYPLNDGYWGYYWSSTLTDYDWDFASQMYFYFEDDPDAGLYLDVGFEGEFEAEVGRYLGRSIRPVMDKEISLNKSAMILYQGSSETVSATVRLLNAKDNTLKWTSSNPSVATVDENGAITAVSKGTATIKAEAKDGSGVFASTCSVEVQDPFVFGAVDLGLSVKWANANVGAIDSADYGDYCAWGETETKKNYDWSTYKWCNGSDDELTKYYKQDKKTILEPSDDIAHVKLGGSWRMPTDAEWDELRTKCTWTWITLNGVNGYKVTSKINKNSIFLPAAGSWYDTNLNNAGSEGSYWSSSRYTFDPSNVWGIYFNSDNVFRIYSYRCNGHSVRPVKK